MLFRSVVEDEVDADGDAALAQAPGDRLEIVHGAKARVDLAVIHHRVAAVGLAGARLQAGHEVDVGYAETMEVIDVVEHAAEVAGEAIDVEDVARHVGPLEPVGLEVALEVEPFQRLGASGPGGFEPGEQRVAETGVIGAMAVKAVEHAEEVRPAALESQAKEAAVEIRLGHGAPSLPGRAW